jgi:hypothetical protein
MRRALVVVAVAVVVAAAVALWPNRADRAGASAPTPKRIVLIGDSLMAEVAAAVEAATEGRAVVHHVLTIGTTNVDDDWWNVWPRVLDEYEPDAVAVLVGPWEINRPDLGSEAWRSWYGQRLDRWASLLQADGARLFWLTAPPARETDVDRGLSIVNQALDALTRRHGAITLVESGSALGGASYRERTAAGERLRRIDGLHLCPAGELRLAAALTKAMGITPRPGWQGGDWTTHEPAYSGLECAAEPR